MAILNRLLNGKDQTLGHDLNGITAMAATGGITLREAVRECERLIVLEALRVHNNDKQAVAKILQISLSSLYRKLGEEPPIYQSVTPAGDTELE